MGDAFGPGSRGDDRPLRLLIKVRLRDGTENERRVEMLASLLPTLRDELAANIDVREARVYREISYHHKSYAEDFDPARLTDLAERIAAQGIEASGRDAASRLDAKHESPVPEGDAP